MTKTKRCKDCIAEGITTKRKIQPNSGGRCATHWRIKKRDRRNYSHGNHIQEMYGITSEEYWAIYEAQGSKCAICQRATGAKRRLSVDHCHATGQVRMLVCNTCNRMMGHLRDDPYAFIRGAFALIDPPAEKVIGYRVVPEDGAPVRSTT